MYAVTVMCIHVVCMYCAFLCIYTCKYAYIIYAHTLLRVYNSVPGIAFVSETYLF